MNQPKSPHIICTEAFVSAATDAITLSIVKTLKTHEYVRVCLCGGSTPLPVYAQLAESTSIPWNRVIITFGDERCVIPTTEDSNYYQINKALLSKIPIPHQNILRMKGELSPSEAADDYESQLTEAEKRLNMGEFTHDLTVLGVGADGHTASLFPNSTALTVKNRRVVDNIAPLLNSQRITMTFPFINSSREVLFLVNDVQKASVVDEIIHGNPQYPASHITSQHKTTWLLGYNRPTTT